MAPSLKKLSLHYRHPFIGVFSIKQKALITEVYMECIGNKYFTELETIKNGGKRWGEFLESMPGAWVLKT